MQSEHSLKVRQPAPFPTGPESYVTAADNVFLRYLNAIQTMCPHILRYLTTAVITNKDVRKRRQVLKDLVKVIQQVRLINRANSLMPTED